MNAKNTLDLSVIIPFKDKAAMTIDCVVSLLKYGPKLKEVLLVSNNSSSDELLQITEYIKSTGNTVRVLEYNHPFNYQKMNNWAVKQTSGQFIMFMNNDTELVESSRGILEKMYKKSQLPSVGITGCLLLYGDEKTIQHAGVYLMPEGQADHMYITEHLSKVMGQLGTSKYPYDITKDIPMSAVTGAVNIIERKKFVDANMYDERFIIGGGDVDLCLRLNEKGLQTWFVSGGYILHKESQSRKKISIPYSDFYWSYLSYIKGYDPEVGDPFLPEITKKIKIYGA
jgi:GT2 family glycosyltransferase